MAQNPLILAEEPQKLRAVDHARAGPRATGSGRSCDRARSGGL